MESDNFMADIKAFTDALKKAEEHGGQEFTCPLCGATAVWGRAPGNNHLHCGCRGCGFTIME